MGDLGVSPACTESFGVDLASILEAEDVTQCGQTQPQFPVLRGLAQQVPEDALGRVPPLVGPLQRDQVPVERHAHGQAVVGSAGLLVTGFQRICNGTPREYVFGVTSYIYSNIPKHEEIDISISYLFFSSVRVVR